MPLTQRVRFAPYDETKDIANIVVDGSPNASTVLTLTHWPGIDQPPGLAADLSAEMVFNYLDAPPVHPSAALVTNNHFDQDGLVGLHTLISPEISLQHRDQLIDVAAAGDFATYRFRESARASMAIWAYAQPDRSPLGSTVEGPYDQVCAALYEAAIPLLIPMITDADRFKELWVDEDAQLSASEAAIVDGRVNIEEVTDVDLAIVTIATDGLRGGHRFASDMADLIHPFAVNNATQCCRLLLIHGQDYRYMDRYETWVQYQTRELQRRVDLEPLRDQLEALETGATCWTASRPSALTPELRSTASSSSASTTVRDAVIAHLRSAPPAWDPYRRDT